MVLFPGREVLRLPVPLQHGMHVNHTRLKGDERVNKIRDAIFQSFVEAFFKQGKLKNEKKGKASEPDGTLVRFEPDPTIFKEVEFRSEHIEKRLRHYSYLNTGLKLILNWKGAPRRAGDKSETADGPRETTSPAKEKDGPKVFQSRLGLMDLVMEDLEGDGAEPIYPPIDFGKAVAWCERQTGKTLAPSQREALKTVFHESGRHRHQRAGRMQDDARELDPDDPACQGVEVHAVCADWQGSEAAHRDHGLGGEDDPPPAGD